MSANFHPDAIKGSFETEAIKADINFREPAPSFVVEEKNDGSGQKIAKMIRDKAEELGAGALTYLP